MTYKRPPLARVESGISYGAIVLPVRKYELERVLYAYERLIDALTRADGGSSIFLITGKESYGWHTRAREDFLEHIRKAGSQFQVAEKFNIHLFEDFRIRAHLLGSDCCVVDLARGVFRTAHQLPPEQIIAEPRLLFFGQGKPAAHPGEFPEHPSLPFAVTDRIAEIVLAPELSIFELRFERGPIALGPGGALCQDCRISFPQHVFCEGEPEFVRVRCIGLDGEPIKPPPGNRN